MGRGSSLSWGLCLFPDSHKGCPYIDTDPVGTGLVPVRGHPQGASLHRIRPMQPPFSCYVGTGFIPVRISG